MDMRFPIPIMITYQCVSIPCDEKMTKLNWSEAFSYAGLDAEKKNKTTNNTFYESLAMSSMIRRQL